MHSRAARAGSNERRAQATGHTGDAELPDALLDQRHGRAAQTGGALPVTTAEGGEYLTGA